MERKSCHCLVSGRVQGVGFRYFTAREARALGVDGWVRNLRDGRVELVAHGEVGAVEALLGRLWHGPPLARVEHMHVAEWQEPVGEGFVVLPTPP